MPDALIRSTDALSQARSWADLPPGDLRRRAATACQLHDADSLISLARAYMTLRTRSRSQRTITAYSHGIRCLLAAWTDVSLLHPARDAGSIWVRQMEDAGLAPATVTQRLAAARLLYRALSWAGATDAAPFADVTPARDTTPKWAKRQPYTSDELDSLLRVATGQSRLLVLLQAHPALRISEALNLQWFDIDLSRGRIFVREGKGGKSDWTQASATLIAELRSTPNQSGYVLTEFRTPQGARYRLRTLCQRAGVTYRACHSLRHYAGTRVQRELGDISKTAMHLRHSSVQTSMVYIHHAEDALENSVGNW